VRLLRNVARWMLRVLNIAWSLAQFTQQRLGVRLAVSKPLVNHGDSGTDRLNRGVKAVTPDGPRREAESLRDVAKGQAFEDGLLIWRAASFRPGRTSYDCSPPQGSAAGHNRAARFPPVRVAEWLQFQCSYSQLFERLKRCWPVRIAC